VRAGGRIHGCGGGSWCASNDSGLTARADGGGVFSRAVAIEVSATLAAGVGLHPDSAIRTGAKQIKCVVFMTVKRQWGTPRKEKSPAAGCACTHHGREAGRISSGRRSPGRRSALRGSGTPTGRGRRRRKQRQAAQRPRAGSGPEGRQSHGDSRLGARTQRTGRRRRRSHLRSSHIDRRRMICSSSGSSKVRCGSGGHSRVPLPTRASSKWQAGPSWLPLVVQGGNEATSSSPRPPRSS
jgi:hypothetical protein